MSSATPETAFNQKPNHITGRNRFISWIGMPGPTPRMRSASAALMPATRPIPTVWHDRMAGNAKTDGDSRIHVLNCVASSQVRNGFIVCDAPDGPAKAGHYEVPATGATQGYRSGRQMDLKSS